MRDRGRIKENFKLKGPNIKTKSNLVPRETALIFFSREPPQCFIEILGNL